jgi:hypothetical protein
MKMTIVAIHPEALCMAKLLTFNAEKHSDKGKASHSGGNVASGDQQNGQKKGHNGIGGTEKDGIHRP